MGPRFRAHMRRLEGAHAADPDFLAMTAFASELCGDYAGAEAAAERALAIEPKNPWAQHALSHVLIRQGRVAEGLARLESFLPLLAAWPAGLMRSKRRSPGCARAAQPTTRKRNGCGRRWDAR